MNLKKKISIKTTIRDISQPIRYLEIPNFYFSKVAVKVIIN